jgi:hypothetical protein
VFRGLTALALATALAPFVFFGLVMMVAFGMTTIAFGPIFMVFLAWMLLARWSRSQKKDAAVEEAQAARAAAESYPIEAYSPPAHFDLLLEAKHDIGRIRGAAGAIPDGTIARQFRALADEAEKVHARLMSEPVKLGLARRFFASYLPRSADLAEGYHRYQDIEGRRDKLLDVLYRLETAMKKQQAELSSPEMSRMDADIRILTNDLKGYDPDFTRAPAPILNRVDEILKGTRSTAKSAVPESTINRTKNNR